MIVNKIINEFSLPLLIEVGSPSEVDILEHLIQECSCKKEIDFDYLEEELNKCRKEADFLPDGVIIVVNDTYTFKQPPHETARYGMSTYEGLIVIKREYIDIAMNINWAHDRLGFHHENCIMHESCDYNEFCEECRNEIKYIWDNNLRNN